MKGFLRKQFRVVIQTLVLEMGKMKRSVSKQPDAERTQLMGKHMTQGHMIRHMTETHVHASRQGGVHNPLKFPCSQAH